MASRFAEGPRRRRQARRKAEELGLRSGSWGTFLRGLRLLRPPRAKVRILWLTGSSWFLSYLTVSVFYLQSLGSLQSILASRPQARPWRQDPGPRGPLGTSGRRGRCSGSWGGRGPPVPPPPTQNYPRPPETLTILKRSFVQNPRRQHPSAGPGGAWSRSAVAVPARAGAGRPSPGRAPAARADTATAPAARLGTGAPARSLRPVALSPRVEAGGRASGRWGVSPAHLAAPALVLAQVGPRGPSSGPASSASRETRIRRGGSGPSTQAADRGARGA
ncbi:cuticle collagen 34-like [Vulpes lagopus]|uniref:cuticle collagen 34-like n=1 Tax=Vulpes lagopus TaxID=494514 RepID=UPI001BCA5F81|nr:cuticle collagen 34-like [Vulpes lagopus]